MKTENNFILSVIIAITIFGVGAFIGVKLQKEPTQPTYSTSDSIANVRIDSVRGEYQKVIDSIQKVKPKIVERVKWLHDIDTLIYVGQDTTCIEIIDRKNALIQGLDSLCEVLDLEARTYSDDNVALKQKLSIEIKRITSLSAQNDSIILFYKESAKKQAKHYKSKLFWNNVKWCAASALGIYGTLQLSK